MREEDAETSSDAELSDSDGEIPDVLAAQLKHGNFRFLVGHPEAFIATSNFRMLAKANWKDEVRHIFVDEAHCAVQWSTDFRPAYRELDTLRAVFTEASVIALTATATLKMRSEIQRLLKMDHTQIIATNTDRHNIRYAVSKRSPNIHGTEESYHELIAPFLRQLKEERDTFPKTVVFTKLKWCGFFHELGVKLLTDGEIASASIQDLRQFHAPLPPEVCNSISYICFIYDVLY